MKMIKTWFGYMTKEEIDCIGRIDKELAKEKKSSQSVSSFNSAKKGKLKNKE